MTRPTWTNLSYLAAGELLTRGLSFLAFAYLGRVLLPAQFGTLGSALAVLMVATLIVDFGFAIVGSREIARGGSETSGLVAGVVGTQLTGAVVVAVALVVASVVLPLDPDLAVLLRGLAASLPFVPFLLNWVFQGRNEMFWYAAPAVVRWLVFLATVVLVVRGPADLVRLPVAEVLAVAVAGLCYVLVYRRAGSRLPIRFRWRADLLGRVAPVGASNLIWAVRMYLPVMFVFGVAGAGPAGLFEAAHRLVMVFVALLGTYFTNLFPSISAAAARADRALSELLRRSLLVSGALTVALTVAMVGLAPLALWLVFGDDYVQPSSISALIVLTAVTPLLAARRTARFGLIALDRTRLELSCSIAGVVVLAALLGPLTGAAGPAGAAWAMWIAEAVGTAFSWLALASALRVHHTGEVRAD